MMKGQEGSRKKSKPNDAIVNPSFSSANAVETSHASPQQMPQHPLPFVGLLIEELRGNLVQVLVDCHGSSTSPRHCCCGVAQSPLLLLLLLLLRQRFLHSYSMAFPHFSATLDAVGVSRFDRHGHLQFEKLFIAEETGSNQTRLARRIEAVGEGHLVEVFPVTKRRDFPTPPFLHFSSTGRGKRSRKLLLEQWKTKETNRTDLEEQVGGYRKEKY